MPTSNSSGFPKEIDRNNAVYNIQNNRNPFIDHPEYVGYIWEGGSPSNPPVISDITTNPEYPALGDSVSVSAIITDEGSISSVKLLWCTDNESFNNIINMTLSSGNIYTTETRIPAQENKSGNNNTETNIFRILAQRNGFSDEAVIGFYENASDLFDDYDSEKMFTSDENYPQIYSEIEQHKLAINGLSPLNSNEYIGIPLGFKTLLSSPFMAAAQVYKAP